LTSDSKTKLFKMILKPRTITATLESSEIQKVLALSVETGDA